MGYVNPNIISIINGDDLDAKARYINYLDDEGSCFLIERSLDKTRIYMVVAIDDNDAINCAKRCFGLDESKLTITPCSLNTIYDIIEQYDFAGFVLHPFHEMKFSVDVKQRKQQIDNQN